MRRTIELEKRLLELKKRLRNEELVGRAVGALTNRNRKWNASCISSSSFLPCAVHPVMFVRLFFGAECNLLIQTITDLNNHLIWRPFVCLSVCLAVWLAPNHQRSSRWSIRISVRILLFFVHNSFSIHTLSCVMMTFVGLVSQWTA